MGTGVTGSCCMPFVEGSTNAGRVTAASDAAIKTAKEYAVVVVASYVNRPEGSAVFLHKMSRWTSIRFPIKSERKVSK
jgi:hypothetical protein